MLFHNSMHFSYVIKQFENIRGKTAKIKEFFPFPNVLSTQYPHTHYFDNFKVSLKNAGEKILKKKQFFHLPKSCQISTNHIPNVSDVIKADNLEKCCKNLKLPLIFLPFFQQSCYHTKVSSWLFWSQPRALGPGISYHIY